MRGMQGEIGDVLSVCVRKERAVWLQLGAYVAWEGGWRIR
jgi:hypothetical protein